MQRSSTKLWADLGRILLGLFLIASGAGKSVMAFLHGQAKVFMFEASLADHPIEFVAMLAVFFVLVAGGLSFIWDGISGLRQRTNAVS